MATNFVMAAVAGLLIFSGYKGAPLLSVLKGGEAEPGGSSTSGTGASGGVGVPGEAAGGRQGEVQPTALPPSPLSIAGSKVNVAANVRNVQAGLKFKEQLAKLVKEKRLSSTAAQSAFNQRFPHYASEAKAFVEGRG